MGVTAPPLHHAPNADGSLRAISFSDIEGWREDDHASALAALCVGARSTRVAPPKTRSLGISGEALARVAERALLIPEHDTVAAREFLERSFTPHVIEATGFVTGYYEPEVEASFVRTSRFTVPLYRRPLDLVEVTAEERPAGWDPEIRFARRTPEGLAVYSDRPSIEDGVLAGEGLEIAWLQDPVDAFFIHVQGSARLRMSDGGTLRIAFDAKSGHPYTAIGRLAVERNLLALSDAHKDGLEGWLKAHPAEARALMRENRSFIFFRETLIGDDEGPIGAAGVPLSPGRSLAVDRTLHTFQAPIWVEAPELVDPDRAEVPFHRLMIAQDTGSAIVGPARGDIFFGSGASAGSLAGRVRHRASMVVLVPNDEALP